MKSPKSFTKAILIFLCFALVFGFTGCGEKLSSSDQKTTKTPIITNGVTDITESQATSTLNSDGTSNYSNTTTNAITKNNLGVTTNRSITTTKINGTFTTTTRKSQNVTTTTRRTTTTTQKTTINPNQKLLALTFDDGPTNDITPKVLEKLKKYNAVATFMLIGSKVHELTADIMRQQLAAGCELGNHSFTHKNLTSLTADEIRQELNDTQNAIKKHAGVTPKFFRPPFIAVNSTVESNISLPMVSGKDATDWDGNVTAQQRADKIINKVKDGDIILLHDFNGNTQTVDALDIIIPTLQEQGYKFVTLSQLFATRNVVPKAGTLYINIPK